MCQVTRSWVDMGSFHMYMWPVAIFMMDQRKEQRMCIKLCTNLGKSATETLKMIQHAFRDQILSHTQVLQSYAQFKASRTSFYNDEHIGSPTSCTTPETVARIQELICQDWHWTIHYVAEEVGFGYGTCTVSQPNLCPVSWQLTRSSSGSTSALNFVSLPPTMKPHDLAPWDFFLFPKMKLKLFWYHWGDLGWIAESA
jgi:hypothetical protein